MHLVLSLFPGVGLLDLAFEQAGFCVVRGPDVLWGGDVRRFHPPAGKFDGVIGGPPCKPFTSLRRLNDRHGYDAKHENLIPEFVRVVSAANPQWWLMENVPEAPIPEVAGYQTQNQVVRDWDVGGLTVRRRRFTFGVRGDGRDVRFVIPVAEPVGEPLPAVTGDSRQASVGERIRTGEGAALLPLAEMRRRQGLPDDFLADSPFTQRGVREAIGQGVPLAMGLAVAGAVKTALG